MPKILLLLLAATLLVFSGCRLVNDGPYDNCYEHYFRLEFKEYTQFKPGSWWVYEDTLYGLIDSVGLDSSMLILHDICDYNSPFEEILKVNFSSSLYTDRASWQGGASASEGFYNGFGPYCALPDDSLWQTISPEHPLIFHDSLRVKGTWYHQVMEYDIPNGQRFFWARNIGLIKKVAPYPFGTNNLLTFDLNSYHLN